MKHPNGSYYSTFVRLTTTHRFIWQALKRGKSPPLRCHKQNTTLATIQQQQHQHVSNRINIMNVSERLKCIRMNWKWTQNAQACSLVEKSEQIHISHTHTDAHAHACDAENDGICWEWVCSAAAIRSCYEMHFASKRRRYEQYRDKRNATTPTTTTTDSNNNKQQ